MPEDKDPASVNLGSLIAEGYLSPRRSMARVLALKPGEGERLLMVGIGIAVGTLGFALLGERGAAAESGGVVFGYVVAILMGLFQYYLISGIVGFFCRLMEGTGNRETDRTLVAWWALVTAPLPVVMMVSIQSGQSPMAAVFLLGSAILTVVLLAAYIAEAHGFRSTAKVCGAMFALLMIFSFVLTSLIPMPMPA